MDKALFHFKKWEACQPEWYLPMHSRAGMGMVLSKITGSECLHTLLHSGWVGLTDGQSFETARCFRNYSGDFSRGYNPKTTAASRFLHTEVAK